MVRELAAYLVGGPPSTYPVVRGEENLDGSYLCCRGLSGICLDPLDPVVPHVAGFMTLFTRIRMRSRAYHETVRGHVSTGRLQVLAVYAAPCKFRLQVCDLKA